MLLSFILLVFVATCTAVRYDDYTLFRGIPRKESHLKYLQSLKDTNFDVNFWTEPGSLGKPVQFSIAPGQKKLFLKQAKKIQMPVKVIQADIQKLFDEEKKQFYSRTKNDSFGWHGYFDLDAIYAWMKDLSRIRGPEILVHKLGTTHENRDILAAIVFLKGSLRRSKVIVEGGIHAREWIAPAFVTYMLEKILNAPYSEDEELMNIAMTYEWYFIPIINPDGYVYTHKTDRMWRKNRNGPGVDLNRNFGFKFGVDKYTKPQHGTWHGLNAFSENESIALSNYMKYIGEGIEYYFAIHSFGQYLIIPYGYTNEHLDNYIDVKNMALKAADAIESVHKTPYAVGTSSETIGYTLGGSSSDWIKDTFKVPYVLTFELRDQGKYGFALPADLIIPTCTETLAGVLNLLHPNTNSFSELKKKYNKDLEKYQGTDHIDSGCQVLYISFIVFVVVFCNILLTYCCFVLFFMYESIY